MGERKYRGGRVWGGELVHSFGVDDCGFGSSCGFDVVGFYDGEVVKGDKGSPVEGVLDEAEHVGDAGGFEVELRVEEGVASVTGDNF